MLFNGYSDVTDYLKNSPINRWIYKDLLTLLPAEGIEVPVVKIFQEIYYQLVSIPLDKHPGADIGKRYLDESSVWLSSASAAQLVFCTVEAMLKRKEELTFAEEIFLEQLQPLIAGSKFKSVGKGLIDYMESVGIFTPGVIEPMPINVFEIPYEYCTPRRVEHSFLESIKMALGFKVRKSDETGNPWMVITDNFSFERIEWFIKLYKTAMEQESLLDLMQESCTESDLIHYAITIQDLRRLIQHGMYDPVAFRAAVGDTADEVADPLLGDSVAAGVDGDSVAAGVADSVTTEVADSVTAEVADSVTAELAGDTLSGGVASDSLSGREADDSVTLGMLDDSATLGKLDDLKLSVSEMIEIVKERFSKSGADEFYGMISNLAVKHGCMNESLWKMIDGIVPAVIERDKPRQTVRIPHAAQVNINPQRVINQAVGAE